MDYVKLGRTGLEVSRICLGGMSFGVPGTGAWGGWSLTEDESRPIIQRAVELGINFFDTANVYAAGTSEEILGRALKDFARRDEIVVATKVLGAMHQDPNAVGLSRKAIMTEVEGSLRRLGTDYIDLYQIHRWDPRTPIEETLEALHDVVKSGKARYIGASSMLAWQFASSLYKADLRRLVRFVSMQDHYNLLYRESEREMLPLCEAEGVGVLVWSPLARGKLTRPWNAETKRAGADRFQDEYYGDSDSEHQIVEAVQAVATARGIPAAQVAMAWVLSKRVVTAPLIGATKVGHLEDAVAALEVELSADEIGRLEAPYVARPLMRLT